MSLMQHARTPRLLLPRIVAIALLVSAPAAHGQELAAASTAFMRQQFTEAEQGYAAVLGRTDPAERWQAALGLADIRWRIRADTASALSLLAPYPDSAKALAMASRARLDAGNTRASLVSARAAVSHAHDPADRDVALLALADALTDSADAPCATGARGSEASVASLASEVMAPLRAAVRAETGRLDLAERLMGLAARAGDWGALQLAWRSYFATARRIPGDHIARAEAIVAAIDTAQPRARLTLARAALATSGLYEIAARVGCGSAPRGADSAEVATLAAYASYLRGVRRVTTSYYRAVARGQGDTLVWKREMSAQGATLWARLAWPGIASASRPDSMEAMLERRFALMTNVGRTGGVLDLHAGHRVSDEERTVVQYGHTAHVHFVMLDGMLSDGYQTWAWGGRPAHGGWATDALIVQVRPVYADGPRQAWLHVTDSALVAQDAATIARDSVSDLERATRQEVIYLPSLAERLRRDVRVALRDSLQRAGLRGIALETTFERAYDAAVQESSIFAHEGRHAIDRSVGLAGTPPAILEYRAKLSEVAFAPSPRLAFAGVLDATIGDASPHGTANARFERGLLAWMAAHPHAAAQSTLPPALQIPLLTDDELRAAARSLDPLASPDATAPN